MDDLDDIELKRLLGYDDKAEYELDLTGLDRAHAEESVRQMLEKSRFRDPRSIIVRIDAPGPETGETLFQPIGRQLLAARRKGVLNKLSPLPPHAGSGFYLVTQGRTEKSETPPS